MQQQTRGVLLCVVPLAPGPAALHRRVAGNPELIGYIGRGALDTSARPVLVVN